MNPPLQSEPMWAVICSSDTNTERNRVPSTNLARVVIQPSSGPGVWRFSTIGGRISGSVPQPSFKLATRVLKLIESLVAAFMRAVIMG